MKKVKKEVKTNIIKAMCECGGEYKPTGIVLTTYPEQYPHDCSKCGKREVFYEQYPKFEYVEVEV